MAQITPKVSRDVLLSCILKLYKDLRDYAEIEGQNKETQELLDKTKKLLENEGFIVRDVL